MWLCMSEEEGGEREGGEVTESARGMYRSPFEPLAETSANIFCI